MNRPILLLWDIDGTLVLSGGAGMRALTQALANHFGIVGSLESIDFAGRTDRWIVKEVFKKFSIEPSEANIEAFLNAYLAALPAELGRGQADILPGVAKLLLEASQRPGVTQALLTGNLRRGAETKLRHHSIWEYFPFGAFADDSELRNELGPFALARAQAHAGSAFAPESVWIIGDTPHDIACGKAIQANTLGLATGQYTVAELEAFQPTAVLPDLSDSKRFWQVIDQRGV